MNEKQQSRSKGKNESGDELNDDQLEAAAGGAQFFLPEVDDEVLVSFESGDPRGPVVVGGLHTGSKPAPKSKKD